MRGFDGAALGLAFVEALVLPPSDPTLTVQGFARFGATAVPLTPLGGGRYAGLVPLGASVPAGAHLIEVVAYAKVRCSRASSATTGRACGAIERARSDGRGRRPAPDLDARLTPAGRPASWGKTFHAVFPIHEDPMRPTSALPTLLAAALLLSAAAPHPSAPVGPPAICHPIDIGEARSLPWNGRDAFAARADYDLASVAGDARAILRASDDALVHMETLRRAVIYLTGAGGRARGDVDAAWRAGEIERLVTALKADVVDAQLACAGGAPQRRVALAWFDAGYALCALSQADPKSVGDAGAASGLAMVAKAGELLPEDGAVHLGASIARFGGGRLDRACYQHLDKALRAADDPEGLVRRNVMSTMGRFLDAGSHDELVAKVRAALERA